jgi:HEAT repeat protein
MKFNCILKALAILLCAAEFSFLHCAKSGIFRSKDQAVARPPAASAATKPASQPSKDSKQVKYDMEKKPSKEIDVNRQLKRLESKSAAERSEAADLLGEAKAAGAETPLIKSLNDEKDEGARVHIVNSLGLIGGTGSSEQLKRSLKQDPSADVRAASCVSLAASGDKSSIDSLKTALADERERANVRLCAGSSLIIFFSQEPGIKGSIEDVLRTTASRPLKLGLVENLRHIAARPEGRELLEAARANKDVEVKKLAEDILGENGQK